MYQVFLQSGFLCKGGTKMKKVLFIIACLFLVGCQTNEAPVEEDNVDMNAVEDQDEGTITEGTEDHDGDTITEGTEDHDNQSDDSHEVESSEENHDSAEETENNNGPYSSEEAIDLVQKFVQGAELDTELNYSYDGEDEQGNYRIQVFEVVDHGEGESHTATYGWYLVNPETGEVTDMLAQ